MKKSIFLFLAGSILGSCSVSNRIIETGGPERNFKNLSLTQQYTAIHAQEENSQVPKEVKTTYFFKERKNDRPEITVNFLITNLKQPERFDSIMFIVFDEEKIKITSDNPKLKNNQFIIPENLWTSMVHSPKLAYGLRLGSNGFDIRPNQSQKNILTEFFKRAMQQRDTRFPSIPEGKKKW